MHPSRKRCNQAFSLLFILRCSLVAAFPSKPGDLSPVLAGRDIDTAASAFNSQINQDGSVPGSLIAELFPTGETTPNENPEDTLLEYGDGNPRAELSSADQREIPPCSQNPDGSTQVPSGKGRFKRQKPEICLPDAHQANPGAVEQKIPGKGQTQGHERPLSPGQQWEPFLQFQKPDTGVTNQGKCIKPEYPVAVCFAPGRISKIPSSLLLGGVMGILEPVSFGCMLTLTIPRETRPRGV